MNTIDAYLNEFSWAMGGALAEQQAARDELRAHILEEVRELQLGGMDQRAAIGQALRNLGEPARLGRSMRTSVGRAPLRRPLLQPVGALILERRSDHHLPSARLLLAGAALAVMALAVSIVYVWP